MNLIQNFLIRYAMGLCKFSRISNILKILKIFDIKSIVFFKTLNQTLLIHNNEFTRNLFVTLNNCIHNENQIHFLLKSKKLSSIALFKLGKQKIPDIEGFG